MTVPFDRAPDETPVGDRAEEEGRRLGLMLDDAHLVLVLGRDPHDTALVALGLARAQASRRRVALGDLLGDAEPIHRLLRHDDPHGLVDSFLYGVSINKIAQRVDGDGELYVLPSGSEPPSYEDVFTNTRWQRLVNGFTETGALLVIAAPIDAARVEDVIRLGDGAVLVGEGTLPGEASGKLLGRVCCPSPAPVAAPAQAAIAESVNATDASAITPLVETRRPRWRFPLAPAPTAGVALALSLAAVGIWLASRPFDRGNRPRRNTTTAAGALPSALDSSVRADSASANGVAAPASSLLAAANPADSAGASAYAVALMTMNTQAGAIWWFQTAGRVLPAATFSPTVVQGAPWFRVLVGAYPNRAQADSLLGVLRAKGEVRSGVGEVVRAPYAFLVDSVKPEAVAGLLEYFSDRGQPVYALRQSDGSARLYSGAFETPEQASLFVESIRASGIRPVLVYRIGRVN